MAMKKYFLLILLISISTNSFAETLTILVTGLEPNNGKIRIGIFDSESAFQSEEYIQGKILESTSNPVKTDFYNLDPGKYAIVVFQDANGNNKVDKIFFGYPTELIGFSGKKTIGKPNFEDAAILFNATKEISIELR
jgi:uncharacterized protein (DUF2141 family)